MGDAVAALQGEVDTNKYNEPIFAGPWAVNVISPLEVSFPAGTNSALLETFDAPLRGTGDRWLLFFGSTLGCDLTIVSKSRVEELTEAVKGKYRLGERIIELKCKTRHWCAWYCISRQNVMDFGERYAGEDSRCGDDLEAKVRTVGAQVDAISRVFQRLASTGGFAKMAKAIPDLITDAFSIAKGPSQPPSVRNCPATTGLRVLLFP